MATAEPITAKYVALYLRISKDRAGRREGVGRQERWGRDYAAQMWPGIPVRVFSDNDVSAFDDDAHRPGYDELRAAVVNGEVVHLWSVEQTRLEANRRRWIDLTLDLEAGGLAEIHTNRDGIVRLDEVADIKNVLSYRERKRLRERLHDTLEDLALEGRPRGGATYGYDHTVDAEGRKALVIVPGEAAVLRWMAAVILSGWSTIEVAHRLNEFNGLRFACGQPGHPPKLAGRPRRDGTVTSAAWTPTKVRQVLTKPGIAGQRVHKGELLRKGTWDPILDEVTWRRVCAHFAAHGRKRPHRGYLLTGWLVCGRCGHRPRMNGRTATSGGKAWRQYWCVRDVGRAGCGKLAISADAVEAYVVAELLARLESDEFRAELAAADPGADRRTEITATLADLDGQRVMLAHRLGDGDLTDDEWDAARTGLEARKVKLTAELATIPPPRVDVDVDQVVAGWHHLTPNERRHFLGIFLDHVVIAPATTRGRRFDTGRVQIRWR